MTEYNREYFLEASGANLWFINRVWQVIKNKNKGKFLDIGCGTGIMSMALKCISGWEAHGTELSDLSWAMSGKRVNCLMTQGLELPYCQSEFSLVLSKDVLPMIRDKHAWFSEIFRVLNRGGVFATYFPVQLDFYQKPIYFFIDGSLNASLDAYGKEREMLEAIRLAGFKLIAYERLPLGTVQIDKMLTRKYSDGFFCNADIDAYKINRATDIRHAAVGLQSMARFGYALHHEWERQFILLEKI